MILFGALRQFRRAAPHQSTPANQVESLAQKLPQQPSNLDYPRRIRIDSDIISDGLKGR